MIRDIQELVQDIDTARQVGNQFQRFEYGYLGEINAMRTLNQYDAILLLLPPESNMPDVYKNDEEIICVFHCLVPFEDYGQQSNASESLQFLHDSLYSKFLNTIQSLMKNNEHKYIPAGALRIVRTSREFNQNYVGLECTMTFRKFSFCLEYSS
jgi:hypothetical protein